MDRKKVRAFQMINGLILQSFIDTNIYLTAMNSFLNGIGSQ